MNRLSLAAAAVVTLGLLAPAGTAMAAPTQNCPAKVWVKEHKQNDHGKKKGHTKAKFVHHGKVTVDGVNLEAGTLTFTVRGGQNKALRGCPLTVSVNADTKIRRNDATATLAAIQAGDHVNVKGGSKLDLGVLSHTATRITAEAPGFESVDD